MVGQQIAKGITRRSSELIMESYSQIWMKIAKGITRRSSELIMESYSQIWMNKGGG